MGGKIKNNEEEFKMSTQIQQKLLADIKQLDSFQLFEVADFIDFMIQKKKPVPPDPIAIDAICGKYKDRLTNSEEFAKSKQEEIELEEKKWQMK